MNRELLEGDLAEMPDDSPLAVKQSLRGRAAGAFVIGLSLFLVVRFFRLINQYAVDVPFQDHWRFYFVLADHPSLWTLFTLQHGPHRMGLGMLVSRILSRATRWNMRAESFAFGGFLTAATAIALLLKRRLFGALAWYDAAIPLFLLTPAQWKAWVPTPIPAVEAIPQFLLMVYALAFTIKRTGLRCLCIGTITFLGLFTGFGLFLGPVTVGLSVLHLAGAVRRRDKRDAILISVTCVAAMGMALLFLVGYRFNPGAPGFVFPYPHPGLYPYAMALVMARACGLLGTDWPVAIAGGLVMAAAAAAWVWHIRRAGALRARSVVIVALISFTLLYVANVVVARIGEGLADVSDSHYVTLTAPCLLAIYLACLDINGRRLRTACVAVLLLTAAYSGLLVKNADRDAMKWYADGKTKWIQTYRATLRIDLANQAAGFPVHKNVVNVQLQSKLDYLREHHLSFFRNSP